MLERDCLPELLALPEDVSPPLTRAHVPSPLDMVACAAELGGSVQEGAPLGADPPRFGGFGAILRVDIPSRCSNQPGRCQGEYLLPCVSFAQQCFAFCAAVARCLPPCAPSRMVAIAADPVRWLVRLI